MNHFFVFLLKFVEIDLQQVALINFILKYIIIVKYTRINVFLMENINLWILVLPWWYFKKSRFFNFPQKCVVFLVDAYKTKKTVRPNKNIQLKKGKVEFEFRLCIVFTTQIIVFTAIGVFNITIEDARLILLLFIYFFTIFKNYYRMVERGNLLIFIVHWVIMEFAKNVQ